MLHPRVFSSKKRRESTSLRQSRIRFIQSVCAKCLSSEANANFTTANFGESVCGRVKGFEKYLIFYRVFDNYIEIVRVLHSAQDIDSIMDDENIN